MRGSIVAIVRFRLRALVLGLCVVGPGLCALPAHAEPVHYDWRLEDGLEYDSNPARSESVSGISIEPSVPASSLARFATSGSLSAPLAESNLLALSGAFGGKWFTRSTARAENVFVVQTAISDTQRLASRTQMGVAASYYDVFQRRSSELPDFRSLAPSLRFEQGLGHSFSLAFGGGYRAFTFKPDDAYSFVAPTAFFSVRSILPGDLLESAADWEASLGGSVEARDFHGPACTASGCADQNGAARHQDRFWIANAEVTRTSGFLVGGGAALHVNQSNSYGEALVRGLVHARAVIPLPWQMSLSVRGELVATRYRDPLTFLQPVAALPSASIEDESRSTFRVDIARLFEGRFEVGARYVFYTSAPTASPVEYRRQTALLYIAFLDER
jgi:hypothetical protein